MQPSSLRKILLVNPNSSEATTTMMVAIAADGLAPGFQIVGATAKRGPSMIVNEAELQASGVEVERVWADVGADCVAVIIGAFGDPGIEALRAASDVPVVGICEASMLEASEGGRRFGVATVTPDLVDAINSRAEELGLAALYTGIQLTAGDPRALAAEPRALEEALADAVKRCIEDDGAEAVIIGGGPLGQAAVSLASRFQVPIVAPISAAVRRVVTSMAVEDARRHDKPGG